MSALIQNHNRGETISFALLQEDPVPDGTEVVTCSIRRAVNGKIPPVTDPETSADFTLTATLESTVNNNFAEEFGLDSSQNYNIWRFVMDASESQNMKSGKYVVMIKFEALNGYVQIFDHFILSILESA